MENGYHNAAGQFTQYTLADRLDGRLGYHMNAVGWWGEHDATPLDDLAPYVSTKANGGYTSAVRPGPQAHGQLYYDLKPVRCNADLPDVGDMMYVWFSAQHPFAEGFYRGVRVRRR